MPRMKEFRAPGVNYGNILQQGGQIKGQRLRNILTERQLQREPETWELQKAQARQGLKQGEQSIRKEDMVYQLEKLSTLSNLLRGVTDTPSYQAAIEQYIRTFPDEIGDLKYLPKDYHKPFVDNLVQATETAQERAAKLGFAGRQLSAESRERVAKLGAESRVTAAGIAGGARVRAAELDLEGKKLQPKKDIGAEVTEREMAKLKVGKLPNLRKRYFAAIDKGRSAQRGVGQFIEDPNAQEVARAYYDDAERIAKEYITAGGNPRDLGRETAEPGGPIESSTENLPGRQAQGKEFSAYATNPETGQKVGWDGTRWVPIQ